MHGAEPVSAGRAGSPRLRGRWSVADMLAAKSPAAKSPAASCPTGKLLAARLLAAMTFALMVASCMSSQTARGAGGADTDDDVEAGGASGAPAVMAEQPSDAGADSEPSVSCTYAQMESNCQIRCYSRTALVSGADCSAGTGALRCTCQHGPNASATFEAPHCGAAHASILERCGP